jgi:hypothetical protein
MKIGRKGLTAQQLDQLFVQVKMQDRLLRSLGVDAAITLDGRGFTREQVARHEAGHAVVARALGGIVWCIALGTVRGGHKRTPTDGFTGITFALKTKQPFDKSCTFAVAGMLGDGGRQLSSTDFQVFFNGWLSNPDMKLTAADAFERYCQRAGVLLRRHARAHDALTQAAAQQNFLDPQSISKILTAADPRLARRRPTAFEKNWWKHTGSKAFEQSRLLLEAEG